MSFKLGLAQSGFPTDGDVLAQVETFAERAAQAGVRLMVFPENLMCPRELTAEELRGLAEPLDGAFCRGIADVAMRFGMWIVATMSEHNPAGAPPYNTALVVDDTGALRGSYRKCHLYDAHGVFESERMSAGEALAAPIETPFGTLGIGICYDLRFPETARTLALAGSDLLLFPSAWHDGPHKTEHWKTLLAARAIENECFVAGICHAGAKYVGCSLVVDPLGRTLACGPAGSDGPAGEALVVADIDILATKRAREAMPLLAHRRPELYAELVR